MTKICPVDPPMFVEKDKNNVYDYHCKLLKTGNTIKY